METKKTTSMWEKLAYSIGDSGANFVWTFTSSFLTMYYTDSVLLAAGVVGTIMLITRLLDGVSDIAFGLILERTHTRIGKARPWFGLSIIPLVVSFLLVFNVPAGINAIGKTVYVIITYILMTVVIYTINNLSFHAMLSRISLTQDDRNRISTVRGIFAFVTGLVLAIATSMLLSAFGGEKEQHSWTTIAFIYATVCLVFQSLCFFGTKEKLPATYGESAKKEDIGKGIKALLHTKYFYLAVLIFIFSYLISGSMLGTAVYYARDVLGDSGTYIYIALVYVLFMVAGMLVTPKLILRFGKRKVMAWGGVLALVGAVGILSPYNLIVVLLSTAVSSFGQAPFSSIMFTLAPDIVDYLEKKTGERYEGLATSANSFGMKVGTGLGSAAIGWFLALGHYDGELSVQPQSALTAEIALLFVLPLVSNLVRTVCISQWRINEES
ncbi:MAG: MFS transporter [Subdoligranulum sp.]|nr:MFS transporter [Subdoligranulum sp.]